LFSPPLKWMGKRLVAFRMAIPRGSLQPDKSIRLFTHSADHPTGWRRPETTGNSQYSRHQHGS
jgi:hypothetical protein